MDLGLKGKLAVVTGSTSGIGAAIARGLAAEGAKVVVNGRSRQSVDRAVERLREYGEVVGIPADVATAEGADRLIAGVGALGTPDILINNAGVWANKPFIEITDDDWLQMFNTNVLSGVRLTRAFFPAMLARGTGRVLFTASEAGIKVIPEMIHYATTKTCYVTIARGLAELTKGTAVTVNSLIVGPTMTEGVKTYLSTMGDLKEMETAYFEADARSSLLHRFARPEEVADFAIFLCSARAGDINGAAQRCEGGIIRAIL